MPNTKQGFAGIGIIIAILIVVGAGAYLWSQKSPAPAPIPADTSADNSFTTAPAPTGQPVVTTRGVKIDMGLDGVLVNIYSGSTLVATGITDSNGTYQVTLQTGQSYTFDFSKPGYQEKTLTKVINDGPVIFTIVNYLDVDR